MALSIKNPEAERLARQIARKTRESLTEAILTALKERLRRLPQRRRGRIMNERLEEILRRVDALPPLDTRAPTMRFWDTTARGFHADGA